jgi:hypothetical protein
LGFGGVKAIIHNDINDDGVKDDHEFYQEILIEEGKNKTCDIGLTSQIIKDDILSQESYPFTPKILIDIPAGGAGIKQGGGFTASISVTAVADINYTYDLTEGK